MAGTHSRHEFSKGNLERMGDLVQGVEPRGLVRALDIDHGLPAHPAGFDQCVDAPTALAAQSRDLDSEGSEVWRGGPGWVHRLSVVRCNVGDSPLKCPM